MNKWSRRSKRKLDSCHPDLCIIANDVLKIVDCTIVYGARSEIEQNELYHLGRSKLKYPKSKHNVTDKRPLSMALDIIPFVRGKGSWDKEDLLLLNGVIYAVWFRLYHTSVITHKLRMGLNLIQQ